MGDGGPLAVSIEADRIAFKVSGASSFTDFSPKKHKNTHLNEYTKI